MIQRIQTVYLSLSLILSLLFYYFAFYRAGIDGALVVSASDHLFLMPMAAAVVLFHVPVIFTYKKRKRQAMLALWLIVLLALYVALGVAAASMEDQNGIQVNGFGVGALLPLISMVLVWLARNSILKDEALVRSMDRLR
jgi:hypothetical protein